MDSMNDAYKVSFFIETKVLVLQQQEKKRKRKRKFITGEGNLYTSNKAKLFWVAASAICVSIPP